MSFFHGGAPYRIPGSIILPPDATGAPAAKTYLPDQDEAVHVRTDRVYVSSRVDVALLFGALYPTALGWPWLYEVQPRHPMEYDPDYHEQSSESMQCVAAFVLSCRVITRAERLFVCKRLKVPADFA